MGRFKIDCLVPQFILRPGLWVSQPCSEFFNLTQPRAINPGVVRSEIFLEIGKTFFRSLSLTVKFSVSLSVCLSYLYMYVFLLVSSSRLAKLQDTLPTLSVAQDTV